MRIGIFMFTKFSPSMSLPPCIWTTVWIGPDVWTTSGSAIICSTNAVSRENPTSFQVEHAHAWRHVVDPAQEAERERRNTDLVGEALADEPDERVLMREGVGAGDDAAGAVTEEEHRRGRLVLADAGDEAIEILLEVEKLST